MMKDLYIILYILASIILCWPALLTGLYRDYRGLFTESGSIFFFSTSFLYLP